MKISAAVVPLTALFLVVAIPLLIQKYLNGQEPESRPAASTATVAREATLDHGPLIHVDLVPLTGTQTFLRGVRDDSNANFSVQFQLTNKGKHLATDILVREDNVKFPINYPSKRKGVDIEMTEDKSLGPNQTMSVRITYVLGFDTSEEAVKCLLAVQSGKTKMKIRLPILYSNPEEPTKVYKTLAVYNVSREGGILLRQLAREKRIRK